jgi:hypothetical protein
MLCIQLHPAQILRMHKIYLHYIIRLEGMMIIYALIYYVFISL